MRLEFGRSLLVRKWKDYLIITCRVQLANQGLWTLSGPYQFFAFVISSPLTLFLGKLQAPGLLNSLVEANSDNRSWTCCYIYCAFLLLTHVTNYWSNSILMAHVLPRRLILFLKYLRQKEFASSLVYETCFEVVNSTILACTWGMTTDRIPTKFALLEHDFIRQ